MGDDLFARIVSQRGSWDDLLTRIPLLGDEMEDYLNMSARRDADRIIRDHIAGLLKEQIARLAQIENTILDKGGLSYMSKTRSAKTKLQTLTDRIGTAAPGYAISGALRVGQEELAEVFAFDHAMLRYVDQIQATVDSLQSAAEASEGIDEAIDALEAVVQEADQAFSLRRELLSGLAKSD